MATTKFEWDEDKRQANIRQHGIDFEDVPPLFDGYTVTVEDTRFAYDETRYITIGLLKGRALAVAHTERGDKIRIISARKATKYEEVSYLQQITNKLGAARRAKRKRH
ncbi:MAG: BrnT family toxin [Chloroflexi bacterium]|nr:BrnT family toxin [Chloroflexota bacterium]